MDVVKKDRVLWVDIAKFIAIIAVITDHLYGVLYTNDKIQRVTFFSVSLFIILSGITLYWSFNSEENYIWLKVKKRLIAMVEAYFVACFIYYIVDFKSFDWKLFINSVIYFNSRGPHYFVLLYLQLIVVSPILYYLLNSVSRLRYAFLIETFIGMIIIFVSRWLNLHTNINDVYGGGGRLFGGTYLFLLYFGMLCGKYYEYAVKLGVFCKRWLALLMTILTVIYANSIYENGFIFDNNSLMGSDVNPPGITLSLYAILVLLLIYFLVDILPLDRSFITKVREFMVLIGQNTLFIFLYHFLFLEIADKCFGTGTDMLGKMWRIAAYYVGMILGSIAMKHIYNNIKKLITKSYRLSA